MTTPIGKLRTHNLHKLENGYPVVRLETGEYKAILTEDSTLSASYAPNYLPLAGGTITGNIAVLGTASVAMMNITYETSSIIYTSGSTKFGNTYDDTHEFTGSVYVTGNLVNVPQSIVNLSGSVTPNMYSGGLQKAVLTDNITIDNISNGTEGNSLELWITPSGSNYTLDFNTGSILLPSDSALTLPKTLTADKTYIVLTKHNGTNWMLVSMVGGY